MNKKISETNDQSPLSSDRVLPGRRRVLEMLGLTAVALPVLGLQACGSDDKSSASSAMDSAKSTMSETADKAGSMADSMADKADDAMDEASGAMDSAADSAEEAMDDAADSMESAAEDAKAAMDDSATIATDGMAKVDENGAQAKGLGYLHDGTQSDNARYQAGQQCSNCALWQGGDSAWGGCPLFAGKQVKATGWCSAYAAAA